MFIDQLQLDNRRAIPLSAPQSRLFPGEALTAATVQIQAGDWLDIRWFSLEMHQIVPGLHTSGITQASKSGSTVTTTRGFFTQADVGGIIRWDGLPYEVIITSVNNNSNATVTPVGTVPSISTAFFSVTQSTPKKISDVFGLVYAGFFTGGYAGVNVPTGVPMLLQSLDSPGIDAITPGPEQIVYGPVTISAVIVNNTTNFELEASILGVGHYHVKD